jgi:hypothetical protein
MNLNNNNNNNNKQQIARVHKDDWLIVVGHHPLDELDEADFVSVLQSVPFDLYLNGHTHTLVQYTIDNSGAYVTSGAGAMVEVPAALNEKDERMKTKLEGGEWTTPQVNPKLASTGSHSYQTVFSDKVNDVYMYVCLVCTYVFYEIEKISLYLC